MAGQRRPKGGAAPTYGSSDEEEFSVEVHHGGSQRAHGSQSQLVRVLVHDDKQLEGATDTMAGLYYGDEYMPTVLLAAPC
ncbi:hypothetical protein BDA96_01G073600 [Sorghum bicolor]|uniref:Uncharacterized protein n=2 Tax=Sorghum bicolor TaxID=4558 RepID=A0A921RXL5_SORBI|nr:hypothetical protein BDA96_01G073600 [Sorghum bicolor]KXG37445.1 hypothetical protein SORBI_3001G071200 [Sorghum bicolor]